MAMKIYNENLTECNIPEHTHTNNLEKSISKYQFISNSPVLYVIR